LSGVANATVDHNAETAAATEVRHHHRPEDAAGHLSARIDHHDVTRLRVVQHVAVKLPLRLDIFGRRVQVLAQWHELKRQRRPDDRGAGRHSHRPLDEGVADTEALELAAGGGTADLFE